ncbi:MAG: iron uptake porin [Symploca sp. SIO1B1]|nr:iron uptake porin [Symploca sp. SIO1C2]NER97374.1 iron uptake porin [Symploca sp. SIO1B1]
MLKISWMSLLNLPAIVGATLLLATSAAIAEEVVSGEEISSELLTQAVDSTETSIPADESITLDGSEVTPEDDYLERINNVSEFGELENTLNQSGELETDTNSIGQVTSVTELLDVSPGDWAYDALRELVEEYKCIVGYPDRTFRGNRPTSRYEFAAGLRACLDSIQALIAEGGVVTEEDLEVLRSLIQEFDAELAVLGTRVDNLDARVAFLEDHQFSVTTKLKGEVIFSLSDAFGDDVEDEVNTVFQNRTRLNFITSFTGKDTLQTRLQAGDTPPLLPTALAGSGSPLTGTQEGRFTYDGPSGNNVELDILRYIFPVGDKVRVQILANDALHHYYVDTVNPYFEGLAGGSNAISRFAERNPIYRIGPFGAGAAIAIKPAKNLRFDLGYIANEAEDSSAGAGLFNGNYSGIAQVVYGDQFKIGLTYVHAYDGRNIAPTNPTDRFVFGGTGTFFANNPWAAAGLGRTPVVSNSYGAEASLRFSPNLALNGWVGYTDARLIGIGDADIWNFAAGLALPDIGKKGNLGGIFFGAAPTLRGLVAQGNTVGIARDFAYHFEAFYKYQVSKNISITPGFIWLLNPNQNNDNDDTFIGTLRTTFTF